MMNKLKICVIEPNLRSITGHVYTVMKEFQKYFQGVNNNQIQGIMCSHIDIMESVRREIPDLVPIATVSCFQPGANPDNVEEYLSRVIKIFDLTMNDVIIMPTAHINEIEAVKRLSTKNKVPKFLLQIHQFFPPFNNADIILDNNIGNEISRKFLRAFDKLNWECVNVATTEAPALHESLSIISNKDLPTLSVPFNTEQMLLRMNQAVKKPTRLGFFGDGRKEKGLLQLVYFLRKLNYDFGLTYYLNVQPLRCFSSSETEFLKMMLIELNNAADVEIEYGELDESVYYERLASCDIVVLPYHPSHYKIRCSGIAIECAAMAIPVLISNGTSVADEIKDGRRSGIIFNFSADPNQFNSYFEEGLRNMLVSYKEHKIFAIKKSSGYQQRSRIHYYVQSCLETIGVSHVGFN